MAIPDQVRLTISPAADNRVPPERITSAEFDSGSDPRARESEPAMT
jgi:hypothetical protein